MRNFATETMLQAVAIVKENATRAEREFDTRAEALQRRTRRQIDLLGGQAVKTVSDIASESRKMCDALYSTYQTLVKMLDDQCRPMLDQEPECSAVRQVRDLIKWLNDESEISNDFTASLNSRSLGNVASAKYIPTLENKMIQSFWETKYAMIPNRAAVEKEERAERLQARAEKLRARQEETRLKNEAAQQKFRDEEAAFPKALEDWAKESHRIKKLREEQIRKAVDAAKASRQKEIEDQHTATVRRLTLEKTKCEKKKTAAEATLPTLGFFRFKEKKETKATIAELTARLAGLEADLAEAEATYAAEKAAMGAWMEEKKAAITAEVEIKHPIPEAPKRPTPPQLNMTCGDDSHAAMEAIYMALEPDVLYTITEIHEMVPELAHLSNQRVSALLRHMLGSHLERVEKQRKPYFRLIE